MIGEWLTHITTPCAEPYRRMGYLRELIAIERRYQRNRGAWGPHLKACRTLIKTAARQCDKKRKVVVLGSGLLLDIPISTLSELFEDVVLVDICHLRATRKQAKRLPNLKFIEADISGVIKSLLDGTASASGASLPTPIIDQALCAGADFVISANLMSQLPLLALDFLSHNAPAPDDKTRSAFARSIIDHHLSLLQGLDCPVTLITETLCHASSLGNVLKKTDPLFGAPLLYEGEEWWWEVAPKPEISTDFDLRLLIRGIANLQTAHQARFCRNTTLAAP